jgi:regulator of cell morphogenesis and NO signaling
MNATIDTTIRDIVAGDYRAASVFHKYGIDFCCGGGRTVDDACRSKALNAKQVLADVAAACAGTDNTAPAFASWDVSTLVAYIIANHHAYVRGALPTIVAYTEKLASVHGENHPELIEVRNLFADVADEMTSHMMKEEQILFPFISALGDAAKAGRPAPHPPFGTVENPIRMMEQEHESAGNAMARINELTGGYQPPADGCTTYRVGLQELDAFERDLHAHVHLENNILFPKALRLEAERR